MVLKRRFCGEALVYVSPDTGFEMKLIDHDFLDAAFSKPIDEIWYLFGSECGIDWTQEDAGFNSDF